MNITCQRIVGSLSIRIIEEIKKIEVKPYKPSLNLHYTAAFSQYRMCDRSRHKFRLSQCRTKRALKGLVVRIPRDKVEVFPNPILKQAPLQVQSATVQCT